MATIGFGRKHLKNPTPSRLANAIKIFTVIGGILLGWIGTVNFIPLGTSSIIQSILGLLIGIANGVLPFFGVNTTQTEVPIENVTQMDAGEDKP